MTLRSLISFLLLALLGVQASVPCCLMGAVTGSERTAENQIRVSFRCTCCIGTLTQSNDSQRPVENDSEEPDCPFCTGAADVKLNSSAMKDLQLAQQTSLQLESVERERMKTVFIELPREADADFLVAMRDSVKRLLL